MLVICLDSDRFASGSMQAMAGDELRARWRQAGQPQVTLVVPAWRCSLALLKVAPHEERHLLRALPWELEDLVPEPVEQLHVVAGPVEQGAVMVIATERNWLTQMLAECGDLPVRRVLCEYELLPWQEGQWTLRVCPRPDDQGPLVLRHGRGEGLCCSLSNLAQVLGLLMAGKEVPRVLVLEGPTDALAAVEAALPSQLRGNLQRRTVSASEPTLAIDLRQGDLAPAMQWRQWWQRWRWPAAALLVLWIADLALTGAAAWRIDRVLAANDAAVESRFEATLPGAVQVDPVLQLRRAVAALDGNDATLPLELLARMAPALHAHVGTRVEQLDYDAGRGSVVMVLVSTDAGEVERLRQALEAAGLRASLLGTSSVGGRNQSRLEVKG